MAAPYDTVNTVLNVARTRLNDDVETNAAVSLQLLDNTQFFTQTWVNTAWHRLQEYLVSSGYVRFQNEPVIITLPGLPVNDPGTQIYLNWYGFWNGQNMLPSPVLPSDLIAPVEVQERLSGVPDTGFDAMDLIIGDMPAVTKQPWQGMWQWRQDALYMPGALMATDIRVSYAAYLPDFEDTGDTVGSLPMTMWIDQPVPIMRSRDALASYICAEVMRSLNNAAGVLTYTADAENSAQQIMSKDFMRSKGVHKVSEYGKMPDRLTPGRA